MAFKPAKCPTCGGQLQLPDDLLTAKCLYCGVNLIVRDAIAATGGPRIETLLDLADKALAAKNTGEALSLYSRALEIDPKNVRALMGKGMTEGWTSTLGNMRFDAMVVYFDEAFGLTANREEKMALQRTAQCSMNDLAIGLFNLAVDHFKQYSAFDSAYTDFVQQVWILVQACDRAVDLDMTQTTVLRNIIHMSDFMLQGAWVTTDAFPIPSLQTLPSTYEAAFREKRRAAAERLQKLAPSHASLPPEGIVVAAPEPSKSTVEQAWDWLDARPWPLRLLLIGGLAALLVFVGLALN